MIEHDDYLTREELKEMGENPYLIVKRKPIELPTKDADELREWAKLAEDSK